MAPTVKCVYAWSLFVDDLAGIIRKVLEENGDGDTIKVEELPVKKNDDGKVTLTDEAIKKISEMEYIYTDPDVLGQIFCHPDSRIKWAQITMAGCDRVFAALKKTERKPDFILTRRYAGFPAMMGEYVIGNIIARERHFPVMYDSQKESKWNNANTRNYRLLDTLTVGILGIGTIGIEVARVCKALNMTVLALVRDERYSDGETHYQHVDKISPLSQLSTALESCDYLVSILPATPQTINMLSGDVLKPCQSKKTVLISVGRGSVIDEASLVNAVQKGWLGGAILDVFDEEPLPPSSPLWTLPGVFITPHNAAISTKELATESFMHNLNAYREGRPMKCVVDFDKGY